jgi:hypothetical protein
MTRKGRLLLFAPLAILGGLLFMALGAEIVKLLWNWLLPTLFGLKEVTFWQALGVLALCRILFGGFRLAGGGPRSRIRHRMRENWEALTPEERERFRQRMRERCGFAPREDPGPAPAGNKT